MATDQALADEIVGTIRSWVDRDVIPHVAEFEQVDEFPQAMFDQMCEFGLFGSTVAPEYGGLGLDITTYARIIEELSRGYMSLAGILNTHKIGVTMIARFGTDEQKQRFLPRMCDGSFRAAFSLSEPDAGSDTGAIRCKAERDGDEWVVNGTTVFSKLHDDAALRLHLPLRFLSAGALLAGNSVLMHVCPLLLRVQGVGARVLT